MTKAEPQSIADWCAAIHKCALDHGWWENHRPFPEIVALIHSEISEAFEEWRTRGLCFAPSGSGGKPTGIDFELADAVIRIMDYCERVGIDLEETIAIKHAYNLTRPYRHGGKLA